MSTYKSKLMATGFAIVLSAVLAGCGSGDSGQDRLRTENQDLMDQLAAQAEAHTNTLAAAMEQAEADEMAALALAAEAADAAQAAALAAAAMQAEADEMAALALAAEAADAAQAAALAAAAMQAEADEMAALALAAEAADAAQAAALAAAAMQAEADEMAALALAAEAADAAQAAALAAAAMMAEEDQAAAVAAADAAHAAALEDAATTATADKQMALDDAETAAAADRQMALDDAATQAGIDRQMALDDAETAAAADKQMALDDAATQAGIDRQMAIDDAETAAAADKKMALDDAATQAMIDKQMAIDAAVTAALSADSATRALGAYTNAKTSLGIAKAAYEQNPTVANAKAYMDAATAAQTAAQAAQAAAQDGNAQQMQIAGQAVTDSGMAVDDAEDAVAIAARDKAITDDAIEVAMAIRAEETAVGPFDADAVDTNLVIGATNTRDDGVKITVTDPDETPLTIDDDPLAESDEYVHTISGWAEAKHERSGDDGVEEVVTTYVNIDPASNEEFDEYYVTDPDGDRPGFTRVTDGILELSINDVPAAAKLGLYSAASFPTAGDQIKSYETVDDTDTEGVDESDESTFSGTFHGIPGDYSCTGSTGTCTATADKNGLLMTLGGTWTFNPDDPGEGKMHLVYGVTADPDHLHFGYWLETTPGEDDDPTTYAFQAFSGGAMAFDGTNDGTNMGNSASPQVYGQAEYSGDAAGVYVRKTLRPDGTLAKANTGEFTADANLTAYFGGNDVRASKHYTIEGTVTDFRDGQARFADWTVKLDPSDSFGGQNKFTGVTTGSTDVAPGAWSGTFYGPSDVIPEGEEPPASGARMQPSGVAGEFNAHFSNGHVAGAYGATKE